MRHRHVLRVGVPDPDATVADRRVDEAVVGVVPVGGGVEVDLLDAVHPAREADPQHLAPAAGEGVGGRIGGGPLGDDAVEERSGLREVRRLGHPGRLLGVHGVEPAVAREVGVEGDEPEALPEPLTGEELRREGGADVEVDVRVTVLDEVEPAVEVRYGLPAGAVGEFDEGVDPGVPHQPYVGGRRGGFRLRERRVLVEHETEAGLDRGWGTGS